jgi:hypothetical protein
VKEIRLVCVFYYDPVISVSENMTNNLLPNGELLIRLKATLLDVKKLKRSGPEVLQKSLKKMMLDPDLADFKIVCEDKSFPCHKNILANQSEVWKTMFSSENWRENKDNSLEIQDFDSKTVSSMINFIYLAELPENEKCTTELLRLADMYAIKSLSDFCEDEILGELKPDNCIEILNVANLLDKETLKNAALKLVAKNFKTLFSTEKWNQLIAPDAAILNKILAILKEK